MKRNSLEWLTVILTVAFISVAGIKFHQRNITHQHQEPIVQRPIDEFPVAPIPEKPKTPESPNISNKIPAYLDYSGVVTQIKEWNAQAKDLTEVGTYGKSKRGTDLYYIRIYNSYDTKPKPKVLITACIHGNEPWSTGVVMGYTGTLLGEYGKSQEITDLVNSRDIYIIPVVSPDSYPHSRHVDGVDPNRDFPGPSNPNRQSVPPVKAVQEFVLKIKPNAVISGHTWGRIFLHPYGDRNDYCPDHAEYQRIIGKMGQLCQYNVKRACEMYGRPIYGTEVDWYYRNGAFAVVMEFGTHQRRPTHEEIKSEFQRTFQGVLWFIKEAPIVELKLKS